MKKLPLAALAAAAACASGAQAQSSVTLFGVVDPAYTRLTSDAGRSRDLLQGEGNTSSRLGFRGVEDLGGGSRGVEAGIRHTF